LDRRKAVAQRKNVAGGDLGRKISDNDICGERGRRKNHFRISDRWTSPKKNNISE